MTDSQPERGPSDVLRRAFGITHVAEKRAASAEAAEAKAGAVLQEYLDQFYDNTTSPHTGGVSTQEQELRAENQELLVVLNWTAGELKSVTRERDLLQQRLSDLEQRADSTAIAAIGPDTIVPVDAEHILEATAEDLRDRLHAVIDMLTSEVNELREEAQALSFGRNQARLERADTQMENRRLHAEIATLRDQLRHPSDRVAAPVNEVSGVRDETAQPADHRRESSDTEVRGGDAVTRAITAAFARPGVVSNTLPSLHPEAAPPASGHLDLDLGL